MDMAAAKNNNNAAAAAAAEIELESLKMVAFGMERIVMILFLFAIGSLNFIRVFFAIPNVSRIQHFVLSYFYPQQQKKQQSFLQENSGLFYIERAAILLVTIFGLRSWTWLIVSPIFFISNAIYLDSILKDYGQAVNDLYSRACLKFKYMMQIITEELMKNEPEIEDNNAMEEEEEEKVEAASDKIETPKIEDQNKFNQELKTSLEQSNTAAAEHEESETGSNHKFNEEDSEEWKWSTGEEVADASNKIETPKIENENKFNQLLKTATTIGTTIYDNASSFCSSISDSENEEESKMNTNNEKIYATREEFYEDVCRINAVIEGWNKETELTYKSLFLQLEDKFNTNPPTAAEHEKSENEINQQEDSEEEEEEEEEEEVEEEEEEEEQGGCELENEVLRDEVQKLRGEVQKLRYEVGILELEKFESEQEVKKEINKYEMKVMKVKKGRYEERQKWEEEKNELAAKLCAATACSELYKGLLHDIGF